MSGLRTHPRVVAESSELGRVHALPQANQRHRRHRIPSHPDAALEVVLGDLPDGPGQERNRRLRVGQANRGVLHDRLAHTTQASSGHARSCPLHTLQGLVEVDETYVGGRAAAQTFPWLHTFIGNMKRMLLGTYHSVGPKHLDRYLAEFVYRANRRWMEADLFDRLLVATITGKPTCYRDLVTGDS